MIRRGFLRDERLKVYSSIVLEFSSQDVANRTLWFVNANASAKPSDMLVVLGSHIVRTTPIVS